MHDIRLIRQAPDAFDAALARRGLAPMSPDILRVDTARRLAIKAAEDGQAELNTLSKQAGAAKVAGDTDAFEAIRQGMSARKALIAEQETQARQLDADLHELLLTIPNLPLAEVPDGKDESGNVEIRRWGIPRHFDFDPREHFDIPGVKPGMDFEMAAKLSGARFVVLRGAVIRVHRALAQFMLDTHITEHGLTETWTPPTSCRNSPRTAIRPPMAGG